MKNSILLQNLNVSELSDIIDKSIKTHIDELKKKLPSTDSDILLTRTEAANFLKVNLSTLHSYTVKGKISVFGIGHRRYYKKQDLIDCLTKLNQ